MYEDNFFDYFRMSKNTFDCQILMLYNYKLEDSHNYNTHLIY